MPDARRVLAELFRRDAPLAAVAALHAVLALVFLALVPFDSRTILGLDPWIKPFKFSASIAVFTGTLAWLLGDVRGARAARGIVSGAVATAMVVEIACIAMQSARGTTSHFNATTAFDGTVFNVMGGMIAINTLAVVGFLALHLARADRALPAAYRLGVALGTVMLLGASAQGGIIIANDAHTVGALDGGPGLPVLDWSTVAGDLRVAHFLGLHAFQGLPLTGWLAARALSARSAALPVALTLAVAIAWSAAVVAALAQALAARPLLPL